ncbi:MAG: type IV toxin-antitoxin system AbiEi family antitoxin domain-containing protein [Nocardioides sp.]
MGDELPRLLADQDDVASWAQLIETGLAAPDVDRMLRRRQLVRVHRRVYVAHTGPLTPRQRSWAAVLYAAPAALCGPSALADPEPDRPVHVAIDASRRLAGTPGVRLHRRRRFDELVQANATPPRLRYDVLVLDRVAAAPTELDVVRAIADAVGSRRTTAARLRSELADRSRMPRRRWVGAVLDDVATGACSVLEHGYLTRVERAHGLPTANRQVVRAGSRGREYRDAEYDLGLCVELDGRSAHDSFEAGQRDAGRDLDDEAEGRQVLRLRWSQVFGTPCRTASRVGRTLQRLGWTGSPRPCGPGCGIVER